MHVTETGEVRIYRMPLTDKHLDHFIRAMATRQPPLRIELVVPANVPREKSAALAKRLTAAGIREIAITAP